MSNRDLAKYGREGVLPEPGLDRELDLVRQTQDRIEAYYRSLGADLEFDMEVAQAAEHTMIRKLAEMANQKLRPRDLRQNMLAVANFRRRTHENSVRVAEVMRAKAQTNIQVNFAEKGVEEEELFEALGVLSEAGVIDVAGGEIALSPSEEGIKDALREADGARGDGIGIEEQCEVSEEGWSEATEASEDGEVE